MFTNPEKNISVTLRQQLLGLSSCVAMAIPTRMKSAGANRILSMARKLTFVPSFEDTGGTEVKGMKV